MSQQPVQILVAAVQDVTANPLGDRPSPHATPMLLSAGSHGTCDGVVRQSRRSRRPVSLVP
jgi:hypothetical protein